MSKVSWFFLFKICLCQTRELRSCCNIFQNLYAPDPDPNLTVERYTRTWEQDEELGLNDIKTENYGEEERSCAAVQEQNRNGDTCDKS